MGKDPDQIRREIEDTRDRMGDTVDAIAYKADVPSRVKDSIAGTAAKVGTAFSGTAHRLGNAVPDMDDVREGTGRTVGMLKENPLGVLLSGIAIGFVVGSLLPSTDLEDERLGPVKENLKSQVQDASGQVLEHGKAVLRETVDAARQSVREHGEALR